MLEMFKIIIIIIS